MGRKIKVMDKMGTHYIFVRTIRFVLGMGQGSEVYSTDGMVYDCVLSVTEIEDEYNGFGLHKIHKSTLVNINHVSKRAVFSFEFVVMFKGKILAVSALNQRFFKTLGIKSWRDLGQFKIVRQ